MNQLKYVTPQLNDMSEAEIKHYREQKLQKQLRYVYRNSEYYRVKFDKLGLHPEEIKTFEDLKKLPMMIDKEAERASQQESMERFGHPFGMHLCASPDDVVITATTSGTSGNPTFSYTLTNHDHDNISHFIAFMLEYAGITRGDRLLFAHALGVYATSLILRGVREAGVLPIDVDVRAGTATILKFALLTKPAAAEMTPSLAEYLIDKAPEIAGISASDLRLRALFTVGEIAIGIPAVKAKIERAYGCRVYDWIGPMGGTLAMSCDSDEYYGMHCVTPDLDLYPDDLIDPETKQPLEIKHGAIGEAIYTSLDREANPLVRFASGDVLQVFTNECPGCGFKGRRIKIIGRSDDMLIVKGANIYPAAIKNTIAKFVPEVTGEIRIVIDQPPPRVVPPLRIKVEHGANVNQEEVKELEAKIKKALSEEVRVNPEIIWCPPGTLEKASTKTPLFEKSY